MNQLSAMNLPIIKKLKTDIVDVEDIKVACDNAFVGSERELITQY